VSNPIIKDQTPIDPNAPVELELNKLVERANGPHGNYYDNGPIRIQRVMSMEIIQKLF
jgi:hypothetical protein